jgi:hypothetical protein
LDQASWIVAEGNHVSQNVETVLYRLGVSVEDDYPHIDWDRAGQTTNELLIAQESLRKQGELPDSATRQLCFSAQPFEMARAIDCISMMPGIAISSRARVVFESLPLEGLQFFPITLNGKAFFLLVTRRCLNCLDRSKSVMKFFSHDPTRVMHIMRYRFDHCPIKPCDLFAIPEEFGGGTWSQAIYVTESVKTAIEEAGLVGLRFSEMEDFRDPLKSHSYPHKYVNQFLGLTLTIPDGWVIQSRSAGSLPDYYFFQECDDDLPVKTGQLKTLLHAYFRRIDQPIIVVAGIELSIIRVAVETALEQLAMSLQSKRRNLSARAEWNVAGIKFAFVDEVLEAQPEVSSIRFAYGRWCDDLSLCATIRGANPSLFQAALTVFEGLNRVPAASP